MGASETCDLCGIDGVVESDCARLTGLCLECLQRVTDRANLINGVALCQYGSCSKQLPRGMVGGYCSQECYLADVD
jgi:hypothetical protein